MLLTYSIGSPPGYLGHHETPLLLTQERLDKCHSEKLKLSILLFNEDEKASDSLWQVLLGILDEAVLTLGDNRRLDFSRYLIILMISNLGVCEMSRLVDGRMGFRTETYVLDTDLDQKIDRAVVAAAFMPEFMNRVDKTLVFRTLRPEHEGSRNRIRQGARAHLDRAGDQEVRI